MYAASFTALAVPIIYAYLGIKSSGDARKRAIGAAIGFMVFYLGVVFNTQVGEMILELFIDESLSSTYSDMVYACLITTGLLIYYLSIKY